MEELSAEELLKIVHGSDKDESLRASSNELWNRQYIERWGDLKAIQDVLLEAGILTREVQAPSPESWLEEYQARVQREESEEDLAAKAKEYYGQAMKVLRVGGEGEKEEGKEEEDEYAEEGLRLASVYLLRCLELLPDVGPVFVGLAYEWCSAHVCEAAGAVEQALLIAELGAACCEDYPPLRELCASLEETPKDEQDSEWVNVYGELKREVRRKLGLVFVQFDEDGDNALNEKELSALVCAVNEMDGVPEGLLANMTAQFGANKEGNLTLPAYLRFYRFQSLQFPEETKKDLGQKLFQQME